MENKIPSSAKVVVIGGGVIGCSVAYHLAKFGWKDTILIERDQLTSGTTWHAAGLVSQLGPSAGITKIRKYSLELYKKLEKEVDFSSGLKLNGALSIATTQGRWQELLRQATTAQLYGVNVEILNIKQIKKIYPVINEEGILGGIFMPGDGQADPVGVTNLLAKAARKEGVKIFQNTPAKKILTKNGRINGIELKDQIIECDYVVLATGMWSRQIGEDMGVSIPLYPAEHFYIITEAIKDLPKNIPVLRDFDDSLYLKEDAGKMLIGIFEGKSIPAFNKNNRVPENFSFGEFPENFEHFEPYLKASLKRVPILEKTGIRKFFSGPESFTPDTNSLLGEVPEIKNLFVCCGLNSIGIGSGGGVGKVTAEWMMTGHINEDLFIYDIKRFEKFHSKLSFIKERITETLGDLYGMHWPFKQPKTSRNQKILPYHEELKERGACFGVSGGYERPMWFALNKDKAEYKYSYNYQNWFPSAEFETKNTIKNVGLFDLTPFSKFDLKGEKSHDELQRLCTANIKNKIGNTTYTQMLNKDGGIETDLTVVCLEKNYFRIIGPAATREHDKFHIKKHLSKGFKLKDVTEDYCCLGLFGPKSRNLVSKISSEDYSNNNFKFGTGKYVNISGIKVWIQRLSYVGELGFELYIETNLAKKIYDIVIQEGKKHKLSHCGMHAMDIMRMESGFLHWGHDISPEENQYEAGLNFTISFKKKIDFIGKDSLIKIKNKKQLKRFVILSLKNSKPGFPLLLHYEPIYLDNKIIGNTTSGNFSFNFNKNLSYGYINNDVSEKDLANKKLYIEVEKKMYEAIIHHKPLKQNNFKII
ncbi:MAG: sarcosine dehydrogenase [Candidatus Pelagibacter sp. TMED64]|nr:sarcosine dehydrogenase [Candidatus Pelagibacter sp.]OUU66302.1 MAG: sarcosine dehydrogenase [Candidatus Pelagibacter sp. TMED64]|tara:strand:+ start:1218 stop:3662 length:2445 start_codon:yes stop_codon:yes gene_type:complete